MKEKLKTGKIFELALRSDSTVLITGPTGSGKSHIAQKIHLASTRRCGPFVTVNLASLHQNTLESELFGHEKGAFTSAVHSRVGLFEKAEGGTLFLDEVGELPIHLQARLLQFIQEKTLSQVGSSRVRKVNVRIIAATNRCLEEEVDKGQFREDLYHRLRVLTLSMKPLCERWEEFPQIVEECAQDICHHLKKTHLGIGSELAQALSKHSWPGNIRELRNVLEYAALSSDARQSQSIDLQDLPDWFRKPAGSFSTTASSPRSLGKLKVDLSLDYHRMMEEIEKEYIRRALSRFRGRINLTARQTGINKTTLIRRIRSLNLLEHTGPAWEKAIGSGS